MLHWSGDGRRANRSSVKGVTASSSFRCMASNSAITFSIFTSQRSCNLFDCLEKSPNSFTLAFLENAAQDFTRRRFRNLLDELDMAYLLMRGDARGDELHNL